MKKFAIIALAAATVFAGLTPANAFPTISANATAAASNDASVQNIQYRNEDRRDWRDNRRHDRRDWRNDRQDWRNDRHDDRRGWLRGHRGHRDARPGYRRHSDGYWYPLAALGLGAIIGGAVVSQPRPVPQAGSGINPRHVQWCSNQYRSYRSYDNTFQPVGARRQQCLSPYY